MQMKSKMLLLTALIIGGCALGSSQAQEAPKEAKVDAALRQEHLLYEVVRHLYRWYMDEADVEVIARNTQWRFWVRDLHPALDDGDKSAFGEVQIPQLGIAVQLKKADYKIDELGVAVKSGAFKITNVSRSDASDAIRPEQSVELMVDNAAMRKYLFESRAKLEFPNADLMERLRTSARRSIREEYAEKELAMPEGDPVIHVSSISPVANELWVFWETGRMLIRFSSDIDLANPAVWQQEDLSVRSYDLDEQVVVSLHEVPGSNAYLTRDQVGRAIFNCVVLGQRVVLEREPEDPNKE